MNKKNNHFSEENVRKVSRVDREKHSDRFISRQNDNNWNNWDQSMDQSWNND